MRRMRVEFIEIEDSGRPAGEFLDDTPPRRRQHSCASAFVVATGTRTRTETETISQSVFIYLEKRKQRDARTRVAYKKREKYKKT